MSGTGIITIKQGPYFRGAISTFALFVSVVCTIALLVILLHGDVSGETKVKGPIYLIPLIIVFTNIFLGFEGVEFDLKNNKVRKYKNTLGMKRGEWETIDTDSLLCLALQYNKVSGVSPMGVSSSSSTGKSYEINLASLDKRNGILIYECKSYTEAKEKLKKLSSKTGIESRDFRKEQLEEAAKKPRR